MPEKLQVITTKEYRCIIFELDTRTLLKILFSRLSDKFKPDTCQRNDVFLPIFCSLIWCIVAVYEIFLIYVLCVLLFYMKNAITVTEKK